MGYLSQASSGVANSAKITISVMVVAPNSAAQYVMQWGRDNSGATPGTSTFLSPDSFVWVSNDPSNGALGNRIQIQLQGVWDSVLAGDHFTSSDAIHDNYYRAAVGASANFDDPPDPDPSATYTPYLFAEARHIGSELGPGTIFHLLFACDLSVPVTAHGSGNPFVIKVNGVQVDLTTDEGMGVSAATVKQSMFSSGSAVPILGTFPPYDVTHNTGGDPIYTVETTCSVPAMPIAFNAQVIGVPKQPHYAGLSTSDDTSNALPVRVADLQVWVGQFTTDHTLFIDGAGSPKNPTIAQATLGEPTFFFQGPAAGLNNSGSGGSFTKTGTISDITP